MNKLEFHNAVIQTNGALDTNDVETQQTLKDVGIPAKAINGRVNTAEAGDRLFELINKYVPADQREAAQQTVLDEFRRHSVTALTTGEALTLAPAQRGLVSEVSLDVPGINQFSLAPDDPAKGNISCFDAARAQLDGYFKGQKRKPPALADKTHRIQIATDEVTSGRLVVDEAAALRGRAYIDQCLDDGKQVLVGVSVWNSESGRHNEGITDHFVTVSGRGVDGDGRLFYSFRDPGAGGREGRLYVDETTGKLFKPGKTMADGARTVEAMQYEVSQVRLYKKDL